MRKVVLLLALSTVLFACKKSNNPSENKIIKEEIHSANLLRVKIKLETSEKDIFKLLFNNIELKGKQNLRISLSKELIGGQSMQEMNLELNDDYFPEEFIIDLGKKNKKVIIHEINYSFSGHNLLIPRNKIDHFFYTNKYLRYNKDSLLYNINGINKNQLLIFRKRIIDSLWINE